VASQAPLGLDRDVFKDERPARLGWHLVQIAFWSAVDFTLLARKVPCTSWQSLHVIKPSFTLWWNGILNAGLVSEWHWKQSVGCAVFSSFFFFLALNERCGSWYSRHSPWRG